MSVALNEAALVHLLESESGPVGQDTRRRAENVARQAEINASGQVIGIESGDLHSGIRYELGRDEQGLRAVIGTNARHRGFAYPAWHDQHGRPWLTEALRDAFDA